MKNPTRTVALGIAALATLAACVSPVERKVSPDDPVLLYAEALTLRGALPDEVLVTANATVAASAPLDTQLLRRVAEGAKDAVLSLYVKVETPARVRLLPIKIPGLGFPVKLPGEALGSGFFIHPSGLVLTNDHVVADATRIWALMADGTDLELTVLARDPVYDLALLQTQNPTRPYPALPMGDSDRIAPGDFAIAVGNPLGLGHTVTFGIISQTGRQLSGVDPAEGREVDFIRRPGRRVGHCRVRGCGCLPVDRPGDRNHGRGRYALR